MLLYQPPFLQVDELTIFPDHADPQTAYYVVNLPEIARVDGTPFLRATALVPPQASGTTGEAARALRTVLSFDVELPAREETLELAREALKERWGAAPERLVGAPVSGGTCEIRYATGADTERQVTALVAASPSLVGSHRTAFTMSAEGQEAEILLAALQDGNLAATVAYALEVPALRPAFEAAMTIHWDRVYQQAQQRAMDNFVFVSEDIERFTRALEEQKVIELDVTLLDPEVVDQATRALFDEFRQQLMEKLFQPHGSMESVPVERSIGNGIRDGLMGIWPGRHHVLRSLDATTLSRARIDLSQRAARPMTVAPQSSLAGLIERAGGPTGRVTVLDLGDLAVHPQRLSVDVAPEFGELGVRRIFVEVEVIDRETRAPQAQERFEFTPGGATSAELRWLAAPGSTLVRHRTQFDFAPESTLLEAESVTLDWVEEDALRVFVDPERVLDVRPLTLEIEDPTIFDDQGRLEIEAVAHTLEAPERKQTQRRTFTASSERAAQLRFIVGEGARLQVVVTETFRHAASADLSRSFTLLDPSSHLVRNPFGRKWSLRVRAIADWSGTDLMIVRVRVYDAERRRWIGAGKDFLEGQQLQAFTLQVGAESVRRAQLSATVLDSDGLIRELGWRDVSGLIAAVSADAPAPPSVTFDFDAPGFAESGIEKVAVFVDYPTAAGGEAETDFAFTADGQVRHLPLEPAPASGAEIGYQAVALHADGRRTRGPRRTTRADTAKIGVPAGG